MQHKSLCTLLRSLQRDEIKIRETMRDQDPARWRRLGRDEWVEMQKRFDDDRVRLKMDGLVGGAGEGGEKGKAVSGRPSKKKKNVRKRSDVEVDSGGVGSGGRSKKMRVDEELLDSSDENDEVLTGTWNSGHRKEVTASSKAQEKQIDETLDPFSDFIQTATRQTTFTNREDLGIFNPYFADQDDDGDDANLFLESVSEQDWELFGLNGDLQENDDTSGGTTPAASAGSRTPPSISSTPSKNGPLKIN
ncbi:hypothetical protein HDU79_007661 [Rhizoclosmatium sp. JEL0117]|nr:hypothetical protein HDU79_007661 [Rhizoclosmatium sp. JEL0117]